MSFFSMHLQYMESFHFSRPAYCTTYMSHVSGLRAELSTYNTSPLSLSLHEGTCVWGGVKGQWWAGKNTQEKKKIFG